jgi:HD-like signal output (HDOD) protein
MIAVEGETVVERLTNIPPFPPAARKLLQAINSETANMQSVTSILKTDPVLSGEVLKVANSALFGLRHEVTSVLHAVTVLGIDRLTSVVLTVGLRDVGGKKLTEATRCCWRHSLATALVSETLSSECGQNKGSAYTAGLMHGVGHFALASLFPDAWMAVAAEAEYATQIKLEQEYIGINHVDAASWLADSWDLPPSLSHSMRCAHVVHLPKPDSLHALACVSCEAADRLGFATCRGAPQWDAGWLIEQLPRQGLPRLEAEIRAMPEMIPYRINDFEISFLH